jgi:hypothetical protein
VSRNLIAYVSLPVPDRQWTPTEWAALTAASVSSDMGQRWTTEIFDRFLVLKRSGRPIYQAQVVAHDDGNRELSELGCEGDPETFNRTGFASDAAVADMFVGATDGLIERYSAA